MAVQQHPVRDESLLRPGEDGLAGDAELGGHLVRGERLWCVGHDHQVSDSLQCCQRHTVVEILWTSCLLTPNVVIMFNMTATTSPGPWVPPDTFAHRLRTLRHELGLTVEEIARECGLKPATWSTWENGRKPHDLPAVANKIYDGTGVDRDWLVWGVKTGSRSSLSLVPPILGQLSLDDFAPECMPV